MKPALYMDTAFNGNLFMWDSAFIRLVWDVRLLEEHRVTGYPFGRDGLLDLRCEARISAMDKPKITAVSNCPLTPEWILAGGREFIQLMPNVT